MVISTNMIGKVVKKKKLTNLSIYIPRTFPPVWGVANNTKETKTMGVLLRSSSNDEGPSRVWTALLEQHSPSSPVFHNLCCFIDAISPTVPIRQPRGNSRCQSELRHNHSPLILIPSTLTCLPHIHPPIIQGSLYSIHPPKPRPPSSTFPVNFCIHYLFQQSFIIHPLHMTEPSQNIHIYSSCQFSPYTCSRLSLSLLHS